MPGTDHAPSRSSLFLPPAGRTALVALGGAVGALARTGLGALLPAGEGTWPWAVLVANLAGAALLGLLLSAFAGRVIRRAWALPLVGTGALGAFTTFSTLALGLERMVALGRPGLAIGCATVSLAGGLVAAVAGIALGRALAARRDVPA